MRDLFGNEHIQKPIHVNIYADEIFSKTCPYTKDEWFYIGLIVENLAQPLLKDIIDKRFCGNFDKHSPYYEKNNRIIHWAEMRTADCKNICKRWLEYILRPDESSQKFYSYILGINNSKLVKKEFDTNDEFNSKYNRFFRSAVLYALKVFFPDKQVIVENIYHEQGTQQNHDYFPWHIIYKLSQNDEKISFNCKEVTFLPKDHKINEHSNIIQLCDIVLGVSTSIIHGIEKSKSSKYREELADIYLELFRRIIENPKNQNSRFRYYNRIIISFFPRKKTDPDDVKRLTNQFYSQRSLYYVEQKSGQQRFDFAIN